MQYLWAPWRMQYIRDFKSEGCFFCAYQNSADDAENLVLKRGKRSLVVMNKFPYNGGHLMVAPSRHVGTLRELEEDEMLELMVMIRDMVELLRKVLRTDSFNVGINIGHVAGAGVADHIHVHIVPRWTGDTNFMPIIADTKVVPIALREMYECLRTALASAEAG